jgi:hypothetical protein
MWLVVLLVVSWTMMVARAGHLVTKSCGFFEEQVSEIPFVTRIEYRWAQRNGSALERAIRVSEDHLRAFAQGNHRCPPFKISALAKVRLDVTSVTHCRCSASKKGQTKSCQSIPILDPKLGMVNTTRLFVGDSRMSGESRVYAHMLREHCGASLRLTKSFPGHDKHDDFGAYCELLQASVFFVRSNLLVESLSVLTRRLSAVTFDGAAAPSIFAASEVIYGTLVWDLVKSNMNYSKFVHDSIEHSALSHFANLIKTLLPSASFVLRAAPPLNSDLAEKMEGPMKGNVALLADTHDTW